MCNDDFRPVGAFGKEDCNESFLERCQDLEEVGGLKAAEYNNWGCCLAWNQNGMGAFAKFTAGFIKAAPDSEESKALRFNIQCLVADQPVEYFVAVVGEMDGEVTAMLTEELGRDTMADL
jgi:hypothetical protein